MIMQSKVALGQGVVKSGYVKVEEPATIEEKVAMLEEKLRALTVAFYTLGEKSKDTQVEREPISEQSDVLLNNDGIPIGTILLGTTKDQTYLLIVDELGEYMVGYTKYTSLSAAAEAVSGVRRSGWTFWKLSDGTTAKESFKR